MDSMQAEVQVSGHKSSQKFCNSHVIYQENTLQTVTIKTAHCFLVFNVFPKRSNYTSVFRQLVITHLSGPLFPAVPLSYSGMSLENFGPIVAAKPRSVLQFYQFTSPDNSSVSNFMFLVLRSDHKFFVFVLVIVTPSFIPLF